MRNGLIIALLSGLMVSSGCDLVKIPNTRERVEHSSIPPTPSPLALVNPITLDDRPIEVPGTANLSEQGVIPVAQPAPLVFTDLAQINAMRCGHAPARETKTMSEIMGASTTTNPVIDATADDGAGARLTDFPGIVKIEPRRFLVSGAIASGHCGATRIDIRWFATAAHCLDGDYDEILLIAGAENIQSANAVRLSADAALCHGGYTGQTGNYANDLALVHIPDKAVAALGAVPIARLGPPDTALTPLNHPMVDTAGWGLNGLDGMLSNTLMAARLRLIGSGPAAITVASNEGMGPCIGDSGGPLFITDGDGDQTLVGVLSVLEQAATGEFCTGHYQGRYTNLNGFLDWIEAVKMACLHNFSLCEH